MQANFSERVVAGNQKAKHAGNGRMMRETFAEIVERCRHTCAEQVFHRATVASTLRHVARQGGHYRAARAFGEIKARYICRAAQLLPTAVQTRTHFLGTNALLLVRFRNRGLHLPMRYAESLGVSQAVPSPVPARRPAA